MEHSEQEVLVVLDSVANEREGGLLRVEERVQVCGVRDRAWSARSARDDLSGDERICKGTGRILTGKEDFDLRS